MPNVELTRSLMAVIWLPWKWIAISNSMPPNDARTPLILHIATCHQPLYTRKIQSVIHVAAKGWISTYMMDTIKEYSPEQ